MGFLAGLQGLPAMRALHSVGASWSQWRSLDIPGTHFPYSAMEMLIDNDLGGNTLFTAMADF